MYSLIIQNHNTIKHFMEHYSLFLDSLEKQDVAYCKWIEYGRTVETAVPEMLDLVKDKEKWRAIIIYDPETAVDESYDVNPYNPYDFQLKNKQNPVDLESPIPLIRLTQMLGGVPSPEINFIPEYIKDAGKPTTIRYTPEKNLDALKAQEELQNKYSYDGKAPSEIWLVAMREAPKTDAFRGVKNAWTTYDEKDSSSFASRNRYPSLCRFMVYNYESEGTYQKKADDFNFWTTVLLLSINYIDPDTLQGYRLYSVFCEFDKKSMELFFQSSVNAIGGMQKQLDFKREKMIQGDLKEEKNEHQRTAIRKNTEIKPIEIHIPSGRGVDYRAFKIYADSEGGEMSNWRTMNSNARGEIDELVKGAERRLNERAEEMRQKNKIERKEVRLLDRFELEDSENTLSHYYDNILQLQKELPDTTIVETETEKRAAEDITDILQTRITKKQILDVALLIDACVLVLSIPTIVVSFMSHNYSEVLCTLFVSLCMMQVVMVPMLFALLWNRFILRKRIKKYNDMLNERLFSIKKNEKSYTNFVNDIVVYSKGYDYLRVMKEMQEAEDDGFSLLLKHFNAMCIFGKRIEEWGKAFHLSLDFNRNTANTYIDTSIPPVHNIAYSIAHGRRQEVPVNSGECIESPFEFVTRLIIKREEIYDVPMENEKEIIDGLINSGEELIYNE